MTMRDKEFKETIKNARKKLETSVALAMPCKIVKNCGSGRSFIKYFSSLQSHNFLNTISWKCFLKDDCIRSSLIEFQSFRDSKIDVDPIYCVLMSLPCFIQVLCMTRYTQVDHIKILVTFVHRINRQKEYKHMLHGICTGRSCSELQHSPVTKDQ